MFFFFNAVFLFLLVLFSLCVILCRNPIHSILFLVLVFFTATNLLLLYNIEFLALIFLIVYVGAIAVLFLFVIMMLNIRIIELNEDVFKFLPILVILSLLFIFEMFGIYEMQMNKTFFASVFSLSTIDPYIDEKLFYFKSVNNWANNYKYLSSIKVLSRVLFVEYVSLFWLAGFILLVSMLGAILLTLNESTNIKRQQIFKQMSRDFKKTVALF